MKSLLGGYSQYPQFTEEEMSSENLDASFKQHKTLEAWAGSMREDGGAEGREGPRPSQSVFSVPFDLSANPKLLPFIVTICLASTKSSLLCCFDGDWLVLNCTFHVRVYFPATTLWAKNIPVRDSKHDLQQSTDFLDSWKPIISCHKKLRQRRARPYPRTRGDQSPSSLWNSHFQCALITEVSKIQLCNNGQLLLP